MKKLLSTREVADFLNVNEKMVYTLVAEKGLPVLLWSAACNIPRFYPSNSTAQKPVCFPARFYSQFFPAKELSEDGIGKNSLNTNFGGPVV